MFRIPAANAGLGAVYAESFRLMLWLEGVREERGDTGYVNDPVDTGGETNWGVTAGTWAAWWASQGKPVPCSIRQATREQIAELYEARYWREVRGPQLVGAGLPRLAAAAFDWGVNGGVVRARYYVQAAANALLPAGARIAVDGVIGPKTLSAVASLPDTHVAGELLRLRACHHRARAARPDLTARLGDLTTGGIPERLRPSPNPSQRKFLRGWLTRCRVVARATGAPIYPLFAVGAEA